MNRIRTVGSDLDPPPKGSEHGARVIAVDDDLRFLTSVRRLLLGNGCEHVECAASAAEALRLAPSAPDLALVDVNLGPGEPSGVDLVRDLRADGYPGFVCMLTGDDGTDTMLRALIAGADDYLLKLNFDVVRDVDAILARRATQTRGAALDPDHHWRFLRSAGLSEEQIEAVWTYAALGFPETKKLAAQLEISEQAASKLMRRAEEKLGVANKGQLARLLTVLSGFGERERSRGS